MSQSATARLNRLATSLTGRVVHAGWIAVVAAAALSQPGLPTGMEAGLFALAALPGVLGLLLAGPRLGRTDLSRLVLALAWTLPGFAAAAAFGSAWSPAALIFLAGPAALGASAGRRGGRLASTMAACGFLLAAASGLLGQSAPAAGPGPIEAAAPWALFAAFLAVCGVAARAALSARLDQALAALDRARPAAEGFARAPAAMLTLDAEGRITAASRAVRRLAPGMPLRLEGLPAEELAADAEGAAAIRQGLSSAQRGGAVDGGRFSFTLRGVGGRAEPVEARAAAIPDGYVLSVARAAAEGAGHDAARLRAERDAALAATRSKSEFLAAVSHELRTPLNAIIGFSDVMKQRLFGPLPARYAEYGDLIHESGAHLLELIGDVLDISKIEADRYELTPETFDARDVVEICAKMLRLRADEQGLALYADVGSAPLLVEADRKAVRQILLNLLSNAVKFTPAGGAVVVMARAREGELVLAVGDSGVGIAAEELDSIGRPYAQSTAGRRTQERGTGLGLALVRALAELHGGEMIVQSAPGEGTTVTVRMPVMAEPGGKTVPFQPLEVHARIRAAQQAGAEIVVGKATA